ncbi:MAG: hypothetical protein HOI53_06735 [Francisellaceae bacterium]|jgi:hypothetical protein|nr:hypothetical protein [Francisellaceae bacterium]MBT6207706.1 hypothetical protein [Francisellaceae bacterium]MBT6538126.1 hypothetical protein [Francisellaceae bacterium]
MSVAEDEVKQNISVTIKAHAFNKTDELVRLFANHSHTNIFIFEACTFSKVNLVVAIRSCLDARNEVNTIELVDCDFSQRAIDELYSNLQTSESNEKLKVNVIQGDTIYTINNQYVVNAFMPTYNILQRKVPLIEVPLYSHSQDDSYKEIDGGDPGNGKKTNRRWCCF